MKKHIIPKSLALSGACLLTVLIAMLGYELASNPSYDAADNNHEAAVILIVAGVPLVVFNLACTLYLRKHDAARGRMLLWIWLAPLAALLSLFAVAATIDYIDTTMAREHPPVSETHFNMSGRALWLVQGEKRIAVPADPADHTHVARAHTRHNRSDPMSEYQGRQLAPGFTGMNVYRDELARTRPEIMPVLALPRPDLGAIRHALAEWWDPELSYLYYHYPDHVEVATAVYIRDAVDRPPTATTPLVQFFIHNLGSQAIARIEIDGQPLGVAELIAPLKDADCQLISGLASTRLAAALKVRWQNAQAAPPWQQATAALAPFPPLAPSIGKPKDNAVHLYFLADGGVTAQRVQTLTLADGKPGARSTEPAPAPAFKTPPTCGTASVTQ